MSARPWADEVAHLSGPDAARCPFCLGERAASAGAAYAVALASVDRPELLLFSSAHCAWSYYDRLRGSWTGAALLEVLDAGAELLARPRGDDPGGRP